MGIETIIEKYGYSVQLANLLRRVYPFIVEYFNDESIVFNALDITPIIFTGNLYECLVKNDLLGAIDDTAIVTEEDVKYALGGYIVEPIFKYNKEENKYVLDKIKRMVALNIQRLSQDAIIPTLIHEICHVIKSHQGEIEIDGNVATLHSGICNYTYNLSLNSDGTVKRTLINESGVGLEEGLNTLTEEQITSRVYGREYKNSEYYLTKEMVLKIFKFGFKDIENTLLEAQIYHDNSKLESLMGEGFYEFMNFIDKVYDTNLEVLDYTTQEEKEAVVSKIIDIIPTEYMPINNKLFAKAHESMTL